jgi:hypothetical protein
MGVMIMRTTFWLENLKKDHSEDLGVDGRIILKQGNILEIIVWNHVAQDRDRWWTLVNTVMNLVFYKRREIFFG